jgi:hypothetical protein
MTDTDDQTGHPRRRARAPRGARGGGARRRPPFPPLPPAAPGGPETPAEDADGGRGSAPRVLIGRGHEGLPLEDDQRAHLDRLRDRANALAAAVLDRRPELGERLAAYLSGDQAPADAATAATVDELRAAWWAYVVGLLEANGVDTANALRLQLLEVVDAPDAAGAGGDPATDGDGAAPGGRRRRQLRLPAIPTAFVDRGALVPSAFPVQGALAAIHNAHEGAGGWRRGRDGTPYFAFEQQQGRMTVSLRWPGGMGAPDDAALQALWGQFRRLNDLEADVVLASLAQWMQPGRDADGFTWITAAAILDYRGIQPKKKAEGRKVYRAGHRPDDLAEVAAAWDLIRLKYLDLQRVDVLEAQPGRRPKREAYTLQAEFFAVPERVLQEQLDGTQVPVAWRFRPGRWIDRHLEQPNAQLALLMQRSLEYDPYRERWEKRLARYFLFHLRISEAARGGAPLRRRVDPMLRELHLDEWLDRRHPDRTVKRFEKAMHKLREDGQIGAWAYTPESRAALDRLPARNWLDEWLQRAVVEVEIPVVAQEQYARLATRARAVEERAQALLARHRSQAPPARDEAEGAGA